MTRRLTIAALVIGVTFAVTPMRVTAHADRSTAVAVRVFNAVSSVPTVTASIDGTILDTTLGFGEVSPWTPVRSGDHTLRIDADSMPLTFADDSCSHLLVLVQRSGTTGAITFIDAVDCAIDRLDDGRASVRAILATTSAGRNVTIGHSRGWELDAPAFVPTGRVVVAAGGGELHLRVGTSHPGVHTPAMLASGAAYTVIAAGAGDQSPLLAVVVDAVQPERAPNTPIHTGDMKPRHTTSVVLVTMLVAIVALRNRCSLVPILMVIAAILTSSCGAAPAHEAPTTAPPPRAPTTAPPINVVPPTAEPAPVTKVTSEAIELDATVVPVDVDRVAELPKRLIDPSVGWLTGSSAIGEPGIVSLVGHVTWSGDNGVFHRLEQLQPDDRVTVATKERSFTYEVVRIHHFDKLDPPADLWGPRALPTLLLISCSGPRTASGLHRDNVAVEAVADAAMVGHAS